jgi:hypothetical protein
MVQEDDGRLPCMLFGQQETKVRIGGYYDASFA